MVERNNLRNPEVQPSNLNLFIFDWSGVISDDRRPVHEANMRVLAAHGRPTMSFEEWLPRTAMTPVEFFREHGVQGTGDELYRLYKGRLDEVVKSGISPAVYPGASQALDTLRQQGKRVAVLSSHPSENLLKEVEEYSLGQVFDHVSGGCRDKAEGLRSVCFKLREPHLLAMYIGDTIYDVRAAKDAGCHSAGICAGYHSREKLLSEKPDVLFEDLLDFRAWFERGG